MRTLILLTMILTPLLSHAQTNCRSVELPDHVEAVCTGDEKAAAVDIPSTKSPARVVNQQLTASEQKQAPETVAIEPAGQQQDPATPQATQPKAPQPTIVHRQGRQQYQKGMDDAKAARSRLIDSLQQSQPAP